MNTAKQSTKSENKHAHHVKKKTKIEEPRVDRVAMRTTVRGNPLSMARFICSYFMLGVCGTGNDDNPEEVTSVASGEQLFVR